MERSREARRLACVATVAAGDSRWQPVAAGGSRWQPVGTWGAYLWRSILGRACQSLQLRAAALDVGIAEINEREAEGVEVFQP